MAKKYNCKICGAELFFNPNTGKMHCEYCGSDFDPEIYNFEDYTDDRILEEANDDNIENENNDVTNNLVTYQCPHCGAEVITEKTTVATTCVYCGRAITLTGNVKGSFKPDFVVPFKKTKKKLKLPI